MRSYMALQTSTRLGCLALIGLLLSSDAIQAARCNLRAVDRGESGHFFCRTVLVLFDIKSVAPGVRSCICCPAASYLHDIQLTAAHTLCVACACTLK